MGNLEFNFFLRSSHLEQVFTPTALVSLLIISPKPSIFDFSLFIITISIYTINMYNEDSYDIDISRIKNSDHICWEYTSEKPDDEIEWFEATKDLFCTLSPITHALAMCSDYVHLDKLKPSNIIEWNYRLNSLYDAGVAFLFTDTEEGEIPIRMNLNDLKDHLGLRIDTFVWGSQQFDRSIRNLRMQNHLKELL